MERVGYFVPVTKAGKEESPNGRWVSKGGIDWRSLFVHTHQVQHTHTQL